MTADRLVRVVRVPFTLSCPKCGATSRHTAAEIAAWTVRPSIIAWHCQICDYDVEHATSTYATPRKPVKHKRSPKQKVTPPS